MASQNVGYVAQSAEKCKYGIDSVHLFRIYYLPVASLIRPDTSDLSGFLQLSHIVVYAVFCDPTQFRQLLVGKVRIVL